MLSRLFVGCCILTLVLSVMAVESANIAIVDFADEWTRVDALRQTLNKFKVEYDDLTNTLKGGQLHFKAENRIFLIGSMTTNNVVLHRNLDRNAQVIQNFVKNGGIVWAPTQADQNERNVDWLPPGLRCVRSDRDSRYFKILATDHPLFNKPNRMNDAMFKDWGFRIWPTVWEVIASQSGFDVLVESLGQPVIMEAIYGKGRFLMMAIAPDKYHIVGKDNHTKHMAGLFMENLLNYVEEFDSVEAGVRENADVNADGVINISDLVLVDARLGTVGENTADVNGDGVVDIADLVLVAHTIGPGGAAAPTAHNNAVALLTAEQVQQWLIEARFLGDTSLAHQNGVRVLEHLLGRLTPAATVLLPNYPNPFNPETWMPYQLSEPADVTLTIYDIHGRVVRALDLGHQRAGIYHSRSRAAYWNGKNAVGEPITSGLYFYTLIAGDFTATRKMLIRK